MKPVFLFIVCLFIVSHSYAQQTKHKPNPRAKALNDSAAKMYRQTMGDPAKIKQLSRLLDASIRIDSYYYDAWNNKIALQGQLDQLEDEYKSLTKMARLFPQMEEVQFQLGILAFKTRRNPEAMAIFNKLLAHYDQLLAQNKNNKNTRGLLYNKGIVLILIGKEAQGKAILTQLFNSENDQYVKSSIGFYINSTRQQIIDDRIPGK